MLGDDNRDIPLETGVFDDLLAATQVRRRRLGNWRKIGDGGSAMDRDKMAVARTRLLSMRGPFAVNNKTGTDRQSSIPLARALDSGIPRLLPEGIVIESLG